VAASQASFGPLGEPLLPTIRALLSSFFPADALSRMRIVLVPRIENPPFFSTLAGQGIAAPLDFREMAGITFVDTILVSQEKADLSDVGVVILLFHEAVHVVQYQHLGLVLRGTC
jgi:hypothetical protein